MNTYSSIITKYYFSLFGDLPLNMYHFSQNNVWMTFIKIRTENIQIKSLNVQLYWLSAKTNCLLQMLTTQSIMKTKHQSCMTPKRWQVRIKKCFAFWIVVIAYDEIKLNNDYINYVELYRAKIRIHYLIWRKPLSEAHYVWISLKFIRRLLK